MRQAQEALFSEHIDPLQYDGRPRTPQTKAPRRVAQWNPFAEGLLGSKATDIYTQPWDAGYARTQPQTGGGQPVNEGYTRRTKGYYCGKRRHGIEPVTYRGVVDRCNKNPEFLPKEHLRAYMKQNLKAARDNDAYMAQAVIDRNADACRESVPIEEVSARAKLAYLRRKLKRRYFKQKPTAVEFQDLVMPKDNSLTEGHVNEASRWSEYSGKAQAGRQAAKGLAKIAVRYDSIPTNRGRVISNATSKAAEKEVRAMRRNGLEKVKDRGSDDWQDRPSIKVRDLLGMELGDGGKADAAKRLMKAGMRSGTTQTRNAQLRRKASLTEGYVNERNRENHGRYYNDLAKKSEPHWSPNARDIMMASKYGKGDFTARLKHWLRKPDDVRKPVSKMTSQERSDRLGDLRHKQLVKRYKRDIEGLSDSQVYNGGL
jgi:hypothetical protein